MFSHRYRYVFVLILALYTYINTVLCQVYYYFNLNIQWYYAFGTILLITLLVWEANRLINSFIRHHSAIRQLLFFFLAGCLATGFIVAVVVYAVSTWVKGASSHEMIVALKLNLIYGWLINLLFHLLNTIFFYFKEYKTKWMEAEELKRISAQAELQLVKSQVNPHFLFNNLNVLSALVMKESKEANRFIEEFSKVYRYILNNADKELVTIQTELDYIRPYTFLLEKRFTEGLTVTMNIPDKYLGFFIIPAALQMLIENAIKHNVVSKNRPLHIDVHVNGNDTVVVSNNLQLKQTVEHSTEIGLQNIIKRYQLVSGRQVQVLVTADAFTVSLPLLSLN